VGIKVVHWGTGSTGRLALRGIIAHPDLQLVGLRVTDPAKVGQDAAALCGLDEPTGVIATDSDDALLALGAECLSYFGNGVMREAGAVADVARYLERGLDVVSTSFGGLIYPPTSSPEHRVTLDAATATGGSSLFATGIEPGFASDLLPLALLSASDDVRQVRISEIGDYSGYAGGDVLRVYFGFGQPLTAAVPLFQGDTLVSTWSGVLDVLAEALGITFDEVDMVHEVAEAKTDIDTACGLIEAGTIGGVRFAVRGLIAGVPVVILEHVNRMSDHVAPQWPRPLEPDKLAYRVEIDGRPNLRCELSFDQARTGEDQGLIATAMRAVNAIPSVHAAAPGLISALDLPVFTSRHVTSG
jgi:2,4-diaminopentanoate dehydrogenase